MQTTIVVFHDIWMFQNCEHVNLVKGVFRLFALLIRYVFSDWDLFYHDKSVILFI